MNTRIRLPDDLATRLVRHAARRAPPALAGRLEEEWLADLATRSGAAARLGLALGCCWAQRALARDPLWATAPAPVAHAQGGQWILHAPSRPTRRAAVIAVIAGLHAGAILSFLYGVGRPPMPAPPPTIPTARFIDEPRQPQVEHVLPHDVVGRSTRVQPIGPIPVGRLDFGDLADTRIGPDATIGPVDTAVKPVVARGGPGAGFPATRDYYPAASIRFEEQGLATVGVCVDAGGRLSADPVVQRSSGYPRLDAGALALARAGSGHYRANSEDGHAVPGCFSFGVRFALER